MDIHIYIYVYREREIILYIYIYIYYINARIWRTTRGMAPTPTCFSPTARGATRLTRTTYYIYIYIYIYIHTHTEREIAS